MKPSDIIQEAAPVTVTNIYTDFKPVEFKSQAAYARWLTAKKAADSAPAALPKTAAATVPKVKGRMKGVKPSALKIGIDSADSDYDQPSTSPQPSPSVTAKSNALNHDYDGYPEMRSAAIDDDDGDVSWASSKVADKAGKMLRGRGGDNSVLVNEFGEKIIVRSFFSFPMIDSDQHQIFDQKSALDKALFQGFKKILTAADYPIDRRGKESKTYFVDAATCRDAVVAASEVIGDTFAAVPLATHHDRPIFWVNSGDKDRATTFALSHWVRIPAGTTLDTAKSVEHYVFGCYDTAGVAGTVSNPKSLFSKFSVGTIERIMDFYGLGANALKRISALKPSRALDMGGDYKGKIELEGLDYAVDGKKFTNPWSGIKTAIKKAYDKTPEKQDKLLQIVDQIIGRTVSSPVKYPVKIEGVSVKDVGFSTNALTVDFMEILHPLIMMKPDGVINNGAYNAARAYLGDLNDDNKMSFDLASCHVAYPSAANAKLFDSMLINPRTNGRLLISSKDGEGAMPGAASLGSVYTLFERSLTNLLESGIDEKASRVITDTMEGAADEFKQMMRFFIVLNKTGDQQQIAKLMPRSAGARKLAEKILAGDDDMAEALNTWDGGNKYGGGKFIKFVGSIMRFTPLVQISTNSDKPGAPEMDRADDVVISGFTATWPNPIFDRIRFAQLGRSLKFKIDVGGGTGEVAVRQANNKRGERVFKQQPRYDKSMARDYSGQVKSSPRYVYNSNINTLKVPGFGGTWNVLKRRLSSAMIPIIRRAKGDSMALTMALATDEEIIDLYDSAMKFQVANGFDPGMSDVPDMTMRQLLNTIGQSLEG